MNEPADAESKRLRDESDEDEHNEDAGKKRRLAEVTVSRGRNLPPPADEPGRAKHREEQQDDGGVGGIRRAAIEGALKRSLEKMIRNEVPLVHALCNREVMKAMIDDLDESCTRKLTREMKRKQAKSDKSGVDVAEVYSPPRMSKVARQLGYSEGFALDLMTNDEEGRPWNLADKECQERALKLQEETKPWMLIASPPCTMFSTLQNISIA